MKNFIIAILITLLVLATGSLFVVREGQRAIVIQFGKVQRDADTGDTRYLNQVCTLNCRLLIRYVSLMRVFKRWMTRLIVSLHQRKKT